MSLKFYRRVAFGLSPNDKQDKDPLNWALSQLNSIPDLLWPGTIPTEKELRKKYGEWVYGDRFGEMNLLICLKNCLRFRNK